MATKKLQFGFEWADLFSPDRLGDLHKKFMGFLRDREPDLETSLKNAYVTGLAHKEHSDLCLKVSPHVASFVCELFHLETPAPTQDLDLVYLIKRNFVHRIALTQKGDVSSNFPFTDEITFAKTINGWMLDPQTHASDLENAAAYARFAYGTPEGQAKHKDGTLFKKPQPTDPLNLIQDLHREGNLIKAQNPNHPAPFDGLDAQCIRPNLSLAIDASHYCLHCHKTGKDSCRQGLPPEKGSDQGCPLDQKISEMAFLKSKGDNLAALIVAMVDNPILAATGHRICNDCKKACIYQKQDPVDIPALESQILDGVLELDWGVEIYSLLTRWNPLNLKRPYPLLPKNKKVLVVGMGPAGFTLSHYLLNEGIQVTAIDGAHIPPRPELAHRPYKNLSDLFSSHEDRPVDGFGGVMDYGITARWNKNYLQLIRLCLERHAHFKVFGGIKFGQSLNAQQAYDQGYQHIALCCGAGKPHRGSTQDLPGGVHFASDFLMSLHQEGSFIKDSFVSFDYTLPAVVIGGGLTSIDTATQCLIYYVRHVEKFAATLEKQKDKSIEDILEPFGPREKALARTYLEHAKALGNERQRAKAENRAPHFLPLLNAWGGVKILYRKALENSPAYRLNHEEVQDALAQGVEIITHESTHAYLTDEHGFIKALDLGSHTLPAKSVFLALGTAPMDVEMNTDKFLTFGDMDPRYEGSVVKAMASAKDGYEKIVRSLIDVPSIKETPFSARLISFEEVDSFKTKVVIEFPLGAQNFKMGQFFRLKPWHTKLSRKAFTLSGIACDKNTGHITLMLFGRGLPYKTLKAIAPGENLYALGPLGQGTHQEAQSVMILADSYGLTLSKALEDDMIHSGCTVATLVEPFTDKDLASYHNETFDQLIVIGSAALLKRSQELLKSGQLKAHHSTGAVGSPMQCAMGGICSRCLQKHRAPDGSDFYVYSCANQDQNLLTLDVPFLQKRLSQNRLTDRLAEL